MNKGQLLNLLSNFNKPVRLSKILDTLELLNLDEEYLSWESMKVSTIEGLNRLAKRGYIQVDKSRWRSYSITEAGMRALTSAKLNNMISEEILNKVF